jgi:secondary thiamine-phosphate synthase enzyme
MDTTTFEVHTGGTFACADLTDTVADWVSDRGDGLLTVFVPHATAGVTLVETGAGTEEDVATALGRLLPRDESLWRHRHGSPGHGADHVLPLVVSPSVTIPVVDGRMTLGTWQSVVLVDPNVDNATRTVRLAFVAG